ncbi:restriction endonuclease subunit S [Leisingera sp. S232]|uniref:restriction endonuclease subunit S n=1 Tax=Leisingera sp. S232 TaxID=3415132 RepID=UPI003C7A9BEF
MNSIFPKRKISDVCELIVDCVNRTAPKVEGPTPWRMLRTPNIRNGRIDTNNCFFVNEETFERWTRRATLKVGDTILTREAPVGEVGLVREAEGFFLGQRLMQYRADPSVMDAGFFHYAMRSPYLSQQFHSHGGSGSVVDHLRVPDCKEFMVPCPPISEQREIGTILGALDDKIELNRKTAATLEEMARALYRSWFVDFDPVHAKAAGRAPAHMDTQTADLFPNSFGKDGLPEGWELKRLGDLIKLNYGKALKKDLRIPGEFPVFGSGGVGGTHKEALVKVPTIIVGRKGTVGSLHWAPNGSWPIDTVFYVTSDYPLSLIMRLLGELPLNEMNTDAAVPGLNRDNAYRLEIPFPGAAIVQAYSEFSDVWQQKIDKLEDENQTLATLRDTLLPRLMSGELRVGAAKGQVEEVV